MAAIPMRAGRPSRSENSTYTPVAAREANNDATTAVTAASALPLEVPPGPVRSPVVGQATRTAPVTTVASAASAI